MKYILNFFSEKNAKIITFTLVALYGMLMAYVYSLLNATVPDETWFYGIVKNDMNIASLKDLLRTPNFLGYGEIYWIILWCLHSFALMRLLSWICLVTVPIVLIIFMRLVVKRKWHSIAIAIMLFLSCPMSWFTGKIIGPELIGNAFGVIGFVTAISGILSSNTKYSRIIIFMGGVVLGISFAIKLYYIVYGIFIAIFVSLRVSFQNKIYLAVKAITNIGAILAAGCTLGFLLSNPIIFLDCKTFLSNCASGFQTPSFQYLNRILFERCIEWDLVNSSGITHEIISFPGLIALVVVLLITLKEKVYIISALGAFLFLTILFSITSAFQGWYFIPLIFLLAICIGEKCNKLIALICFANFVLLAPDINFQFVSKYKQYQIEEHRDKITRVITNYYKDVNAHEKYEYIDFLNYQIPQDSKAMTLWKYNGSAYANKQFIVISNKVINLSTFSKNMLEIFLKKAKENQDGYTLLYSDDLFYIVLYSSDANSLIWQ